MTREPRPIRGWSGVALPLAYVVGVLLVDTLIVHHARWPIEWARLAWAIGDFNLLRCLTWLVIPLAWSARDFDWAYYGWSRWTRGDFVLAAALAALGVLAVVCIPLLPGVAEYYRPPRPHEGVRWRAVRQQLLWNAAWFPGWEFMHRYFLLRRLSVVSSVAAVLIVAAVEGVYHLQKPALEAVAMVLFSLVASTWAVKRNNGLLPLLVHGTVELALSIYWVY